MTRAQFLGLLLSAASLPARADCGVYCARRYGAKADGKSDDTRAIQAAVDAAAKSGGGIVRLSGGVFLSGTVYLRDNIGLEILPGAKLKASVDKNLYNRDDFCPQNAAIRSEHASGAHLLVALEAKNVSVFGGGEIDGSGLDFWMQVPENASVKFPRKFAYPRWRPGQMLFFCECRGVSVRNVRLSNAPFWTCFFHGCSDVFASGLSIKNDPRGHNNDGIDIDSCSRAVVSGCSISTEDDCITVRANPSRLKNANAPCEDVAISGCVLQSTCNGVRIGVGSGRIRRCSIDNIIVKNTFQGISFIGAYHGRGGAQIEDVRISDALIRAMRPLNMLSDSFNWGRSGAKASIRNVAFSDCSFGGDRSSIIAGHLEKNISGITFRNCDFEMSGGGAIPKNPVRVRNLEDWKKNGDCVPAAIMLRYAKDILFDGCRLKTSGADSPWKEAVDAFGVENCEFRNCLF